MKQTKILNLYDYFLIVGVIASNVIYSSLYTPGCPGTQFADQAVLEL